MMQILHNISEPVLIGITLAVCFAVPRIWMLTIQNNRDIQRSDKKVDALFERMDKMSSDVSFIRGKIE